MSCYPSTVITAYAFFRHDPVTKSDIHDKRNKLPLREEAVGR